MKAMKWLFGMVSFCVATFSQVIFIDRGLAPAFAVVGNGEFTVTHQESYILGGARTVRVSNSTGSSHFYANPAGPYPFDHMVWDKTDAAIASLGYGDFLGTAPAEDLDLNLNGGYFNIVVGNPFPAGPFVPQNPALPLTGRITLLGNGETTYHERSLVVGNNLFYLANFGSGMGTFDWPDVSGIDVTFSGSPISNFTIQNITYTPVPEPATYALVFSFMIVGFVLWSRRGERKTKLAGLR
jgi:hypothetical protein